MDPVDFVSLAVRLSGSHNEAELRSAVSRSYYGAFRIAKTFLADCGIRWPRKESYAAEIHRKVRHCLSQSANVDAMLAGDQLWSLRDLRNQADYELESTMFKATANVATAVRIATEIVDSLQRCRSEPAFSEVRENIRKYARDVLRISIDDT